MDINVREIGSAFASPTKSFFVKMLTRDIELEDALLDLLDNCVDGIIRKGTNNENPDKPYEGYSARIVINPEYFIIEDNCGGIPIDVAHKYAFAMGKPEGSEDTHSNATVGMYGIGMKRAIFKIGTEATVESHHDTGFIVEFTPEWMKTEGWENLPLYELEEGKIQSGTRITIFQITEESKPYFSDKQYISDFRKKISQHYALIIQKGFQVFVHDEENQKDAEPIRAEEFNFLSAPEDGGTAISPYIYIGEIDGVSIEIYAGLYRELMTEAEAEGEEESRGRSDDAGWTIACNDRIVVWKDKTKLTGWGDADVPNYHGQFIAITGIVLLKSDEPKKLPLTTTKRGVDAGSAIYSEIKDMLREITKNLTTFTNRWKKFPKGLEAIYKSSTYKNLHQVRELSKTVTLSDRRKTPTVKKFSPMYPIPSAEKTSARVTFVASKDDIERVAKKYFGEERVKPGIVGEAAFNEVLEELK